MKADAAAVIDEPGVKEARSVKLQPYLDKFKQWAIAKAKASGGRSGEFLNPESLREWDRKYNHRRIEQSFGTDEDIREAGVRALYSRVLAGYLHLDAFNAPTNVSSVSPGYELDVQMSAVIRGIYIPEASEEERKILIEEQENVIRRAGKRLIHYKMPHERLTKLFRELEEQARKSYA